MSIMDYYEARSYAYAEYHGRVNAATAMLKDGRPDSALETLERAERELVDALAKTSADAATAASVRS